MQPIVLAFALSSFLAQTLPDAEAIMKRVTEAAEKRQSLEYVLSVTSETIMESGQRGQAPPIVPTVSVSLASAGRMRRLEFGTSLRVTDGSTTWLYDSSAKQYSKTSTGERMHPLGMLPLDWLARGAPQISEVQGTPKTIGEDSIEIAGKKYDCWLVQDELKTPDVWVARVTEGSLTSCIDKDLLIALRNEISLTMVASTTVRLKVTVTSCTTQLVAVCM